MINTATRFACFGGEAAVSVLADGEQRDAVELQKARLLAWHGRFSCFDPTSELSRFNADLREVVPASEDLRHFARAVALASDLTDGLVDATLPSVIAAPRTSPPLALALRLAPPRRPARGRAQRPRIRVDDATVRRPPGLTLDSGGLAKGLFADWSAEALAGHHAVAVDCGGDLRIIGAPRTVRVTSPFDHREIHAFVLADAGVATSGIGRRAWLGGHHLLDPSTGRPAYTGVVQVTAIAPTALEAEMRAKAALLSADDGWLPYGGVIVRDDGSVQVKTAAPPSDGVDATPRNCHPAGGAPGFGTMRRRSSSVRSTTSISMWANAAPMQRRTPPPNGIHA